MSDPAVLATTLDPTLQTAKSALTSHAASSASSDPLAGRLLKTVQDYLRDPAPDFFGAVPRVHERLSGERGRKPRRPFDPRTNVRIGVTVPTVPPEKITIEEVKGSNEVSALRDHSSFQVMTGRGFIQIELELVFPSLEIVNDELFEIIKQFRTSPFLTLESEYVAHAVYGRLDGDLLGEEAPKARAEARAEVKQREVAFAQARTALYGSLIRASVPASKIANFGELDATEIEKLVRPALAALALGGLTKDQLEAAVESEKKLSELKTKQRERLEEGRKEKALDRDRMRFSYALNTVPVCLQSLSVAPLPADGLRARLSLIVFNHLAYTPRFLYRTVVGGWTPEISRCTGWYWLFNRKAAALNMLPYRESEPIRFRYPRVDGKTVPGAAGNTEKEAREVQGHQPPLTKIDFQGSLLVETGEPRSRDSIVVTNFACSIATRLALHPILSSQYPTVQYLGALPGQVVFQLMVPHGRVQEIHEMKRSADAVSLNPAGRRLRRGRIRIEEPSSPLALFGFREFQIESLTTESVSPSHSRVELRLNVFHEVQADRLEFDAEKSGYTDEERLRRKLERLFQLSAAYKREKIAYDEAVKLGRDGGRIDPKTTYKYRAHELLYAPGQNGKGAIVPGGVVLHAASLKKAHEEEIAGVGNLKPIPATATQLERLMREDAVGPEIAFGGNLEAGAPNLEVAAFYAVRRWGMDPAVAPSQDLAATLSKLVLGEEKFEASRTRLIAVDFGVGKDMRVLDEDLESHATVTEKPSELYPDLLLPTYGRLTNDLAKAFIQSVANRYGFATATVANQFPIQALPREVQELLKAVAGAPTHEDLGHIHVPESWLNRIAVTDEDYVDPDFYFYRIPSKKQFLEARDLFARPLIDRMAGSLPKTNASVPDISDLIEASKAGTKYVEARLEEGASQPDKDPLKKLGLPKEAEPVTKALNEDSFGREPVETIRNYASPSEIARKTFHDDQAPERVQALFNKHVRSIRDDLYRMVRAFPTFKLYLVEEDDERLLLLDDWYGFNAVREAHVTRHKWEPDVCELELLNVMGTLDDEGFQKIGGREDQVWQDPSRRERWTAEQDPRDLDKFPIREGTRIVLKFGYSATERELETVFTGKVVEVNRGDVVSLVAQGYAAELTFPIPDTEFDLPSWWGTGFKRVLSKIGVGFPELHGMLALISEILSSQPCEHLGAWGLRNILPENLGGLTLQELGANEAPEIVGPFFAALLADQRLQNVLPTVPLESALLSRGGSTLNDEDIQKAWVQVQGKTGLQLLRELNFHHPDMVFSVVPFDHRGTLFFGRPDEEYVYTDKNRREQQRADADQARRINPLVTLERLEESFSGSLFAHMSRDFHRSAEHQEYERFARDLRDGASTEQGRVQHEAQIQRDVEQAPELRAALLGQIPSRRALEMLLLEIFFEPFRSDQVGSDRGRDPNPGATRWKAAQDSEGIGRAIDRQDFRLFWAEIEERTPDSKLDLGPLNAVLDAAEAAGISRTDESVARIRHRRLLFSLLKYLRRIGRTGFPQELQEVLVASEETLATESLGRRPFRSYHFVDSLHHILANHIVATRAEMENIVYVQGKAPPPVKGFLRDEAPGPPPIRVASIDDDLLVGEYIPGFKHAPNAETDRQQVMASYAHLAEGLRPMYRGELILRGNERIKPHDVCVAGHTRILTETGWRPIVELREGDRVISHTGAVREVTATMNRTPEGKCLRISALGDPDTLEITENHPLYLVRKVRAENRRRRHVQPGEQELCPGWVPAGDALVGDYVLTPIPTYSDACDIHRARLLGYYLAEGCLRYEERAGTKTPVAVQWCLGNHEDALADEIEAAALAVGYNKPRRYRDDSKHSLTVVLYSREFAMTALRLCGRKSREKTLAFRPNREACLALLGGYLNGDGHLDRKANVGRITAVTVSHDLALSLKLALASVGIAASVSRSKVKGFPGSSAYAYIIGIAANEAKALLAHTKWRDVSLPENRSNKRTWIWNGYIVHPIESIEEIPPLDRVYNISVSTDQSYVCGLVAVHNCWILDLYNGMWGPIEVERVIHHFSYEHGFTTTVIPHLHCTVSNNVSWMETTGWNVLLGVSGVAAALGGIWLGSLAGGIPGALAGGLIAAGVANDTAELESGGSGVLECLTGHGSFGRKQNPVTPFFLLVNGLPFTAGLRGYRPGNQWFYNLMPQTKKRFELWTRGAQRLGRLARSTLDAAGASS